MALTLQEIITEADVRVPNSFSTAQKVTWLNEINQEFFNIVKIPKTATFTTVAGTATAVLTPTDIRGKDIDKVHVGNGIYSSFLYDDVKPGRGYHTYDDTTRTITIVPTPTTALPGIVRYHQIATTTFVTGTLTATPDAPIECHELYVNGLAEKMALSLDDMAKAANYGQHYRAQLTIAQANYSRGG